MRRQKYAAKPTVVDGHRFASRKEARRYGHLKQMMAAGEIRNLTLQPRFDIEIGGVLVRYPGGRKMQYVADFMYVTRDGREVIEDAKGVRTQVYRIKRALMLAMGKEIEEV